MNNFSLTLCFLIIVYSNYSLASDKSSTISRDKGNYTGGVYYDNLNKLNARVGYSFYLDDEPYKNNTLQTSVFSSELELGLEGYKVTLSHGHASYAAGMGGTLRYGLSYANIDNDNLAGAETIVSVLGISLKLGVYRNLDQDNNEVMLGIGFGL